MVRHTIHLPLPPSNNRIWRSTRNAATGAHRVDVYRDKRYVQWLKHADMEFLAAGHNRGMVPIAGNFEATIAIADGIRGDLDNRIKATLDWAQRAGIIVNDKNCRRITIGYIEPESAPKSCVLDIVELAEAAA